MITRGKLFLLIRRSLDLQQDEAAKKAGISAAYLSLIEHEKKRPDRKVIDALCQVYNVPSILFYWEERDLSSGKTEEERKIIKQLDDFMQELFFLIVNRK